MHIARSVLLVIVEHLDILDFPIDDLELENFVVRNSQRMSLRLYNKRRPLDQNAPSASPAVKRCNVISLISVIVYINISKSTFLCTDYQ